MGTGGILQGFSDIEDTKSPRTEMRGLRLSINPRTAKMQKSKPEQTKNPLNKNKKNFTQPYKTAV